MARTACQDGRVPWRGGALPAVAVMTLALAGTRPAIAAEPSGAERGARNGLESGAGNGAQNGPQYGSDNGRMACGDAPRPPVRLHLIDRAGLSSDTRTELMRETLAPWRAAGASVAWAAGPPHRPAGLGEPRDVYVLVEADAGETTDGRQVPMASILFVDGRPTTHITAHAGHVARSLAALRLDDVPFADRPRLVRERVLGRVLGRAIAHEVGHFLSGSREHAPTGLMRASHRIEHLMQSAHPMFQVVVPATPTCLVARMQPK
jgi:hypothetical protein